MKTIELVKVAFKKYKQNVYYEQLDLFQRKKLADFECDGDLEEKLKKIAILIDLIKDKKTIKNELPQLFDQIDYHLIPKSIENADKKNDDESPKRKKGLFLTNKQTSDEYVLEGTNYFIDAPIELHLICVIWVMKVGVFLDSQLCNSCFGFRLNDKIKRPDDRSSHLFKLYHEQYAQWRDGALDTAKHVLKDEKRDIAILSLDLKQCFYYIDVNFKKIQAFLGSEIADDNERQFAIELTKIIEKIHIVYRQKILSHLKCTHETIAKQKNRLILPIGLISSGILCNWYLREFDNHVIKELNPAYYGRYVDDFLIVISNPEISKENKLHNFIDRYFCKKGILQIEESNNELYSYCLSKNPNLLIKEEKMVLHFYAADHSYAMLDVFKQKIIKNSSAFYLLPDDDLQYYINETAYNMLFDGSTNKFRNLTGVVENVTELSKNLTNIITGLGQSKINQNNLKKISDQLFKFYKGKNFINFCRTWEKLFTFTIITNQHKEAVGFYNDIQETINKIKIFSPESKKDRSSRCLPEEYEDVRKKQLSDLQKYLNISIAIPVGLLGLDSEIYTQKHEEESIKRYKPKENISEEIEKIKTFSTKFRESNLIRHNYIAFPLINYTNYKNSLIDWDTIEQYYSDSILDRDRKLQYSPRFIHFDEFYLFNFLQNLLNKTKVEVDSFRIDKDFVKEYIEISHIPEGQCPIDLQDRTMSIEKDNIRRDILIFDYFIPKRYSISDNQYDPIKIGVANIKVRESDIKASISPLKKPNLSFVRQKDLFNILNLAKKEKCDLLVLPELSIPYRWLPFMVKYARNHQLGIIFGMEYWLIKKPQPYAYNMIVTALPIRNEDEYKSCCLSIRCKNHYSPLERKELERAGLAVPINQPFKYDLFRWRGCQFSIYNCYELADIEHRSIFRSELDFLVACVLNKDKNYFAAIVDSVVKDLHCFVIQVNCSEYGDSRIVRPTNTERMDILRVSGGDNKTILTAKLDIKKLREFQCLEYSERDKEFKPTPPGFDRSKVRKRGSVPNENDEE